MIPGDNEGKAHRRMPWLLCRTPDPHDTGQLRMPGHTHLDRAIEDERFRTLRRFQRFQQRDGPDLTTVFQPDSELTAPTHSHNMAMQQLTAFCFSAITLLNSLPSHSLPSAVELPGWSDAGWLEHSGRQ